MRYRPARSCDHPDQGEIGSVLGVEDVVTAQDSCVQTALVRAHRAAVIDTLSGTGISAEVVAGSWPAVLEDPGSRFPLRRQGRADRVDKQVVGVSGEIQASQGATDLSLSREQCYAWSSACKRFSGRPGIPGAALLCRAH